MNASPGRGPEVAHPAATSRLSGLPLPLAGVVGFATVKIGHDTGQALDPTQVARGPAPAAVVRGRRRRRDRDGR